MPGEGETTYDPAADYQVGGVFLPLGTGTRERQTIHGYDSRDRLVTITVYECTAHERPACAGPEIASTSVTDTYEYDDAGNRTKVVEDNGAGAVTRYYCYDARNQLTSVSTSSATCASGVVETYAYDAAGNRTANGSRSFTYNAAGQLQGCSSPTPSQTCGTPTFDPDGRLIAITLGGSPGQAWTYQYDAEGRLTTACKASSCTGTPARLDMTYDAQGHRIRLVETTAGGSPVVTTDFSYEGDRVVREVSTSSTGPIVTRSFTTDEAGAIIKLTIVTTGGGSTADDGTYLVTYNGHGDAIALAEIETINGTGVLTTANRMTYSTWGTPSITTHNGYGSLGFRYLYVGRFDVQWDDFSSAGLLYMHARHYHPEFGRFLQPDPSALETNLYAYAGNSPVTKADPSGLLTIRTNHPDVDRALRAYCFGSQARNVVCALAMYAQMSAERETKRRFSGPTSGNRADAFRHCCWSGMMVRAIGSAKAEYIADDLYEMNERLGEFGNTLALRRMDLKNNRIGREYGRSVAMVVRISYLFGHEISRERALDVEFKSVAAKCWTAAWNGRLQVRP